MSKLRFTWQGAIAHCEVATSIRIFLGKSFCMIKIISCHIWRVFQSKIVPIGGLAFLFFLIQSTAIRADSPLKSGFICNWSYYCSHITQSCSEIESTERFQTLATGTMWIRSGTTIIPVDREDLDDVTVFYGISSGIVSIVQYFVSISSSGRSIALLTSPTSPDRYGKLVGECDTDVTPSPIIDGN